MDAKWSGGPEVCWAAHQSDQTPNPEIFPEGIRPVSDAARERGMKFLLWFVPNSVFPETGIVKDHPEWLGEQYSEELFGEQVFYGLDHGDGEVNQFMIDHFSKVIADYGVDVFRTDGTHLWPSTSDPERLGMNQIRYNEGFYAFWDGLLERNPDLLIDNCGCGGRKLDIETIKRSVVLWRTDSHASGDFDPASSQAMTYGLSMWLPLFAAPVPAGTRFGEYAFRSSHAPAMLMCWTGDPTETLEKIDVDAFRRILNQYRDVQDCYVGDYYPLTPYSLDADMWMAWQFDRPDQGRGVVQAFRRAESDEASCEYKLRGLDADAEYRLTDLDTDGSRQVTGQELMEAGVTVEVAAQPGSAILTYERL